jgi:tetratricopeptide (TPR) repeat protein
MNAPSPLLDRARQAESSGQFDVAYAAYERARMPTEAARVAARAGWFAEAAKSFGEAGLHYESAACYCRAARNDDALAAALRVAREHPTYRKAAQLAVRLAEARGAVDLTVDNFLTRYLAAPPQDEHDLDAFDRAARLFERQGDHETAHQILQRVAAARPSFRDIAERLLRLDRTIAAVPAMSADHAREAVDFMTRNAPKRPGSPATSTGLPGLPGLPDLPPPPTAGGASQRGAPLVSAPPPSRSMVGGPAARAANDGPTFTPPTECDALALPAGFVLAGRYTIERKVGEGGMAAVYSARDTELDERVALKAFQSDDPQLVARFRQEVALSRQLAHPNVIRLHDIGSHGRIRFMTMELLEGRSLDACVGRPLDPRSAAGLIYQACAGLGAAHARGIVHRDIKPANFFLAKDNTVKLMDFGIAKLQSASHGVTTAGFIAGTPHYMAPEQISNFSKATALSDLYSIGVMAFELLTGNVPFEHEDLMALLMMHLREPAPSVRSVVPTVPAAFDGLVAALLAKDPEARPQSCEEVAQRLRAIARELPR